ncbi:MAG: polymorphic toxin-type HINT domain-containing protein [Litoreibacter sp.]
MTNLGDVLLGGNGFEIATLAADAIENVAYCTNVKAKKRTQTQDCGCSTGGRAAGSRGGTSSFPEGTEVLTPNGRVAIETLREGDLVVARNEDSDVSGVFPVTALMSRTSPGVLWLTLENKAGTTTRMGVTSKHPLFVTDDGWIRAGDVAAGDAIRDKDLRALTVLAVKVDNTPTRVHNLEVAGAYTYFAGEFEA